MRLSLKSPGKEIWLTKGDGMVSCRSTKPNTIVLQHMAWCQIATYAQLSRSVLRLVNQYRFVLPFDVNSKHKGNSSQDSALSNDLKFKITFVSHETKFCSFRQAGFVQKFTQFLMILYTHFETYITQAMNYNDTLIFINDTIISTSGL